MVVHWSLGEAHGALSSESANIRFFCESFLGWKSERAKMSPNLGVLGAWVLWVRGIFCNFAPQ